MKKLTTVLIVSLLITSSSFAAQSPNQDNPNQNRSFYQSVKSTWNSFLDALAGKSSRHTENTSTNPPKKTEVKTTKVTVITTEPAKSSSSNRQNESSLYNSIKSGWNSFLDVLTGKK